MGRGRRQTRLGLVVVLLLTTLFTAPIARGETASWSFDLSSWDFGVVVPGSGPTPPKTFTLTNTGDMELSVIFVSVGSEFGGNFSIAENKCQEKLAPGASCTISVIFNPSTAGPKSGQLAVASQGGLAPQASVELRGTGAGPAVAITPTTHVFDPLGVGAGPSLAKSFTVTNEGQLDLTISSIYTAIFLYSDADQFPVTGGTCGAGVIVPPQGSCTVEVAFGPTRPGWLAADLFIASDAPGSPHRATVEGIGIASPVPFPLTLPVELPRAEIFRRPGRQTARRNASFWFRSSPTAAHFLCRLDGRKLHRCSSPVRYQGLRAGRHRFAVRAIDGNGRSGQTTVVRWHILQP
jgi:hypothetical protein